MSIATKPNLSRLPLAIALMASTLAADMAIAEIEEIVVTAQRRAESVQDVPVSVTAFDTEKLKAVNVSRTSDLSAQTPNLQAVDGNFGLAAPIISLRGVSNTDFTAISNTPISVYSDGVLLNNVQTHGFAMFDLERVEVLRGPQGTLFGRNSTTGAMQVISAKPTDYFEKGVEVTLGERGRQRIEGFVSGALIEDKLKGRFAFAGNRSDGYVKDQAGNNVQEEDVLAVRTMLDAQFSDNLDAQLKLQYQSVDNTPVVFHNTLPANLFDPLQAPGGEASDYRKITLNQDYKRLEQSETLSASVTLNWDLGNTTLTSVTAYLDHDMRYQNDEDASTSDLSHSQAFTDQKQFTQEFRLHAEFGKWDVVAGLFYLKENVDSEGSYDLSALSEGLASVSASAGRDIAGTDAYLAGFAGAPAVPGYQYGDWTSAALAANPGLADTDLLTVAAGILTLQQMGLVGPGTGSIASGNRFSQDLESAALFTHAKYTFNDQWSATIGLRYTEDEKDLSTKANRCILIQDRNNPGRFDSNAALIDPLAVVLHPDVCPQDGTQFDQGSDSWSAFSGKLGFEYRINGDILTYFNLAKGFKGGGFDQAGKADLMEIDPETLISYELGAKTTWFNNRMVLNAALFHYDYRDFQAILAALLPDEVFPGLLTFNVPESTIDGAEVEFVSEPIDNLNLSLGFAWLQSNVDKGPTGIAGAILPDIEDNEFRYAPSFSFNGTLSYNFNLGDYGYLTPQLDWVFTDEYYTDVTNREAGKTEDVWKTNLRLSWTDRSERYYATAFVENLEDKVIITSHTVAFIASAGTSYSTVSAPRTFGLTFGARF